MELKINLSEALSRVRAELLTVNSETRRLNERLGDAYQPIMEFSECELEFNVEFESDGKGGMDIKVIQFSAGRKHTESNKIKIKYTAISNAAGEKLVAEGKSGEENLPRPRQRGVKK